MINLKEGQFYRYNSLISYGDKRQMEGSYAAFESCVRWCDSEFGRLTRARKKARAGASPENYELLIKLVYLKRVRNVFKRKMNKVKKLVIK